MLVNGNWQEDWQPVQAKDEQGRFVRQRSSFRTWLTPKGEPGPEGQAALKAEPGRFHLFVAYICPWASRALMVRKLKGLEDLIGVTVVNPKLTAQGWRFDGFEGSSGERFIEADYLHQLYSHSDAQFTGRATVPVLWDKQASRIINNESADILRMLNTAFVDYVDPVDQGPDLYPKALANDIDALNAWLYQELNNGVYRAGFASTQEAYEEAYAEVFTALDELEARFSDGRDYLFGDQLTESDIRLFVTLVRFDAAYHGLFKCNRNCLRDMPRLHAYMQAMMRLDGVAETVRLDHIKAGYYSIEALNPSGIVPVGPAQI